MRFPVSALAIAMLAWVHAAPAEAYTVQTGFTEGCHERITAEAFVAFVDDPAWAEVVVPESGTWRKLGLPLNEWLVDEGLVEEALPDPQLFVLFSLIVGVRAPDTRGRSATDLATQRSIHASPDPEAQYVHALRAPEDDEPDGSDAAVMGTRASIRRFFSEAAAAARAPSDAQISEAPFTIDFYDLFQVETWRPAFLLGKALHTLQDSFSHSIRADALDFRMIVHVLNYVDAIYKDFRESRDGIAHSRHLDRCDEADLGALREAVDLATEDFFETFLQARAGDTTAIDDLLDNWVTLQEGCTFENDFCDNGAGVAVARQDPTDPILPEWMTCSASVEPVAGAWAWFAGWSVLLALAGRRRRRG
ncbi:MAG: hypothetical protein WCE62_00405 [Polyangiales bacterium]